MINHKLLNKLLKDEKKVDGTLYTSGPMWRFQNYKIAYQIRKNGISAKLATFFRAMDKNLPA